jgi:hypothetical protein
MDDDKQSPLDQRRERMWRYFTAAEQRQPPLPREHALPLLCQTGHLSDAGTFLA